jgi:hypothetical protein
MVHGPGLHITPATRATHAATSAAARLSAWAATPRRLRMSLLATSLLTMSLLTVSLLTVSLTLTACSNPQLIENPPPKPAAATAQAPQGPDAYRDHAGPHVAAGEVFRLKDTAYAIDGAEVVVSLVKAAWSKRELPDGRVIREGSAELQVARGEESTRRILEQGESKTMLGVKVSVVNAGEDYDDKRMDYIPWVELKVEAAP